MDLTPGSVVASRYRADYRVGAGGMGEVWAGEHLNVGVKVAMKTLLGAAAVHHEVVARFKREAFLLGRVRSDHCARVLDFVEDPTHGLVLVMEFIEGESLADVLDERCLTPEEGVLLAVDLTTALCDLHRANVVHRDLKPGNLILQPLPDGRTRAVVVDFGISRLLSSATETEEDTITGITKANMALGTVEYMAPEQILSSRDVTPVSDIYAVGAILYRALTGGHAFGDKADDQLARAKLVDDAPPLTLSRKDRVASGLQDVVRRAIKRRPADRYRSAEEMLRELLPVRDLVNQAALDLDTTTADGHPLGAAGSAAEEPAPAEPRDKAEDPSAVPASFARAAAVRPGPQRARRAQAIAVAVAAVVGVAAAVALAPREEATPEPTPPERAVRTEAPASPGPAPEEPPATVPAEGEAAGDPPRTIDLDEPVPGDAPAPPPPAVPGPMPSALAGVAQGPLPKPEPPPADPRWLPPMPEGEGTSDPFSQTTPPGEEAAADPSAGGELPVYPDPDGTP